MNPLALVFSPVAASDAEELASLRVEAMRESLERVGRFDPARARSRFLDHFSAEHTRAVVLDGQRVGFFVARPQSETLLLDHLYVSPSHQNQGIGSAVLQVLFAKADDDGRAIRVGALRGSASNRFYARHGFDLVEEAEFDNYYLRRGRLSADILVREADDEDALCLHALATQVFLDTYATEGIRKAIAREAQAELSVAAFLEQLAAPSVRVLLAERKGHLVGFASVTLRATHALVTKGPAAELSRLYVQSPFVRQGVGTLLLRNVEDLAQVAGASTLWLTAWVGNTRALAFYTSQGYEELGSANHVFENERIENRLFIKALVATS